MGQREKMLDCVRDYRLSGLSQKEFCLGVGIGVAKLNYWIGKSKERPLGRGFIALHGGNKGSEVTLEYPGGVKITVGAADLSLISRLIKL